MSDAAGGGRLRAWLEVLRAPLLLSPIADVLAGWSLGYAEGFGYGRLFRQLTGEPADDVYARPGLALAGWSVLARAAVVGVCLLAAGMAQNAVADADEDRRFKPTRPIPRGAIAPAAVHAAWILLTLVALGLAATLGRDVLLAAGAIAGLTAIYHAGLKRFRVAGCLALGALRGLDLALGGLALMHAASTAAPGDAASALSLANLDDLGVLVPLYAIYVAGASLHASTDDEPGTGSGWSRLGLGTSVAVLVFLAGTVVVVLLRSNLDPWRWLAPVVLVVAIVRLVRAWRTRPAPAVTGVALSNIYFFGAFVVLMGSAAPLAIGGGALILGLFAVSRLALRVVPPS